MIKLLGIDTSGAVPCPIAENKTLSALRGLRTIGGTSLAGKFPQLSITLKDGHDAPRGLVDYFKSGLLNIVSEKLKSVLEFAHAEIEYFPVDIIYNEKLIASYFVANPLIRFKAVDLTKSDVELDPELGDAISVKNLVIDESKFSGVEVSVIDEIQRIAVSSNIVLAIKSSGCIGCSFVSPSTIHY